MCPPRCPICLTETFLADVCDDCVDKGWKYMTFQGLPIVARMDDR